MISTMIIDRQIGEIPRYPANRRYLLASLYSIADQYPMTFLARRRSLSMLLNIGAIYVSLATNNTQDADGTCQDGNIASSGGTCAATAEMINGSPSASASTPQCGLYLAESTIPGAGLGIFTTTEKQPGDTVGSGDVCLPNIG